MFYLPNQLYIHLFELLYHSIHFLNKLLLVIDVQKDFINENLTESQTEKLKEVLSDENKTKELLNSDLAKQLFKKLTGGDFNGRP